MKSHLFYYRNVKNEDRMQTLKLINIKLAMMVFIGCLLFVSCQEGYDDINEPDSDVAIKGGDDIADLILKMVLKDGSYDNIIDGCSEISIKYPYSVRIDGEKMKVSSLKDVERISVDYFEDRDNIEINYPVTVSYSDYSEELVKNPGQLKSIQAVNNVSLEDDDIESIDFVYPIEMYVYNKRYQKSELKSINSDKEMHKVFRSMSNQIVELDFPLVAESLKKRVTVGNNRGLKKEIDKVKGLGNENDKVTFADEDYPYNSLLTIKDWKVMQYTDKGNKTYLFESFVFDFKDDNTIHVNVGGEIVIGEWELELEDGIKILELEFDIDESPLELLNEEWEIKNNSHVVINMEAGSLEDMGGMDDDGNRSLKLEAIGH